MGSVVDYDPRWPALFEQEAALLRGALGMPHARVEHIGSTAVPGLPARPVIDLLLVVDGELTGVEANALRGLGYVRVRPRPSGRLHLRKGAPRTHCLHVATAASRELWDALAFRDLLRRDDPSAARYGALKRSACEESPGTYSRAKTAFIRGVLEPTPGVEPASN
jgi:GrpB-like predicted nucleotidyltransferase (UPF0157 family)